MIICSLCIKQLNLIAFCTPSEMEGPPGDGDGDAGPMREFFLLKSFKNLIITTL